MTSFLINDKKIDYELSQTLLDVKKNIIKELELACSYVDISFLLDKPIRILGKFNIEPGLVPRTLDRHKLETFALRDNIAISITEINDYNPELPRKKFMSGGRGRGRGRANNHYVPPSDRKESLFDHTSNEIDMDGPKFNLDSHDDFPSL